MKKKSIGIMGFGRFGRVIHRLFEDSFDIRVSSSSYKNGDVEGVVFDTLENVVTHSDAVFLTVPINRTGDAARRIKPYLTSDHVVVDVCSVKEYPNSEMKAALQSTGATVWPTHPMFGPDSTKQGFEGLVWVTCQEDLNPEVIAPYLSHLRAKGLRLVEIDCETHDRMAARTQGLTHFIGRFLDELAIAPTDIDTLGYRRLMAVREQTCNDTWELFCDLQHFNRFSREIQESLWDAIFKVRARFLDTVREQAATTRIGMAISERRGAEAALDAYSSDTEQNENIMMNGRRETVYLPSLNALLRGVAMGDVDVGVFCIQAQGEAPSKAAFDAMGRYMFAPAGFVTTDVGVFAIVQRRKWNDGED